MKAVCVVLSVLLLATPLSAQQPPAGVVHVMVDEIMGMVSGLLVRASGHSARTDSAGVAQLRLPAGKHVLSITQLGYKPTYLPVSVVADSIVHVAVTVEMASMQMEAVRVSATRTERLAEETPTRVEIVDEMEVDENTLMAPSGITMLLNETPGLRVQAASPTLGTGSVRILGLPGQYTVMLADGLPLYGGGSSALGPLDISPVDLQRVEIIKGAASALYGGQALGGVINLVSKPANGKNELLFNRRMFGVTDAATWLSREIENVGGLSLLASGTLQGNADMDGDGWADQAKATRWGVRPRFTAVDSRGRSLFVTAGYGYDERDGGGTLSAIATPGGATFREGLLTNRGDFGARAVLPTADSGNVAIRLSMSGNRRAREFGAAAAEKDRSTTGFLEVTRSFVDVRSTTVLGTTLQADDYRNSANGYFDHLWLTPSFFWTNERELGPVTLSLSARGDLHAQVGAQLTERIAALVKPATDWSVRLSAGTGFAAPTAITEETEAIGLRTIRPSPVGRERSFGTMIDVGGKLAGAELLVTGYSSVITRAIQLANANDGSNDGRLVNSAGPTRSGGVEAAAIWRFDGGKFLTTYGYNRGTQTDALTGVRKPTSLIPRHRAGADLMFEREGRYRWGVEAIYYGEQHLHDNPYRALSKPYVYTMAIYMRQFGPVELVANFENLLDVRQTDTDPLLRPSPTTGGRWTTDVWAPLEGFMGNFAVRYRWQ